MTTATHLFGRLITFDAARKIAAIDYPANPRGIGAPTSARPDGIQTGVLAFDEVREDPQGRGVWLISGAHRVPCRRY